MAHVTAERLRHLAAFSHAEIDCPFSVAEQRGVRKCVKAGGVCSLRLYEENAEGVRLGGSLVATCPQRLLECGTIYSWIGETLLGDNSPAVITELPFLLSDKPGRDGQPKAVGKIDRVLVVPRSDPLRWCAVEMQAVYFSGAKMSPDLVAMRAATKGIPFPLGHRHPDFRSSGPKRLLPQLQTKVPTLGRWGKRMAVVIDRPFWDAFSGMDEEADVSNADIIWFVVRYEEDARNAKLHLVPDSIHSTTLSSAVRSLTGGRPMSQGDFEKGIRAKIPRP